MNTEFEKTRTQNNIIIIKHTIVKHRMFYCAVVHKNVQL